MERESQISERARHPKFGGEPAAAASSGAAASFRCGCFVRIFVAVDDSERSISSARFETNGCDVMIAAADLVCEKFADRKLADLHGAADAAAAAALEPLNDVQAERKTCLPPVVEAVQRALAARRQAAVDEFIGEKALICTCFSITEEQLAKCIDASDAATVEDVIDHCRAGGGCGSCQPLIAEILDSKHFGS